MAGRAHKKLLAQQLAVAEPGLSSEAEEESSSEEEEAPAAPFNPFSLLTDDEDGGAQEQDSDDEQPSSPEAAPPPRPAAAAAAATKRASKSKKKGSSKRGGGEDSEEEAAADAKGKAAVDEEDLDAILQELNLQPSAAAAAQQQQQQSGGNAGGRPLLAVDMRQLKADEELKRMFGSRVVEEDEDEGGAGAFAGASRRVRRLAARGLLRRAALKAKIRGHFPACGQQPADTAPGLQVPPLHCLRLQGLQEWMIRRKTTACACLSMLQPGAIINPRENWSRFDGGFSMELQGTTPDGRQRFGYAYSQAYQAVQDLYEECQATFDPNNIAALLQNHPYHLDALLTMHDLYRSMGEQAYAEEMLERALYALEMSWHPSFSPAAANVALPYSEQNAPLFICLFRYTQSLSRRGLHRTALEVCKLLLALDSDDPLGALCTIDYLALRAGRYDFLDRLAQQYGGDSSVALLPNIAFSLALARWYQEQEASSSSKARGAKAGSSSSSSAAAGGGEQQSSADLLVKAVLLYPEAVVRLQRVLAGKGVGGDAAWAALLSRPLFAAASDGGSASLGHLIDIWVERQHLLWKAQPVQEWLRAACERAAADDSLDLPDGLTAADWACVREQAWPASEENEYGHLRIHDYSDAVSRIPPEEIHGMAGAAQHQQVDMAALEAEMRALAQQIQAQPDMTEEELQQVHPLAALLRSLLPWVNLGQAPEYGADDDAAQQEQQQEGGED